MSRSVRPETLSRIVLETIRNAIVNQDLPSGSRVTEAGLARQLDVSKTPVREALLQLREVGLIEPDERRGGRIVRVSRDVIREAYEVREALEVFAARAVAERADDASVAAIYEIASRSLRAARAGDDDEYEAADGEFHRTLAAEAGNSRLEVAINHSLMLVSALRRRDVPATESRVECARSHLRVARAIRRRDTDSAGNEIARHIRFVGRLVLAAYDDTVRANP